MSPQEVFKNVYKAIEGTQCKPDSYSIKGSSCSVTFNNCLFADKKDQQTGTAEELSKVLVEATEAGVQVALKESTKFVAGVVPRKYKYKQYTYPRTGTILANVETDGEPTIGGKLSYEIKCKSDTKCNAGVCSVIAAGTKAEGKRSPLMAFIGMLMEPECERCS